MKNYYKILQIDPSADLEVLNGAYRARVKQCHPDRYHTRMKHLMHEQMTDINEAYHILQDADRRNRYDADFKHWQENRASAPGSNSPVSSLTKKLTPTILLILGLLAVPLLSGLVLQGKLPVLFIAVFIYMGLMFKRFKVPMAKAVKPLLLTMVFVAILGRFWFVTPLLIRLLVVVGGFFFIRRFAVKSKV